jgi:hypothetical protein
LLYAALERQRLGRSDAQRLFAMVLRLSHSMSSSALESLAGEPIIRSKHNPAT